METAELMSFLPARSILVLGEVFLDEFVNGDCFHIAGKIPGLSTSDLLARIRASA